jgi:alginate O-acetyltransferase complex protein AlgI
MVFSSSLFIFAFLPLFLAGYFIMPLKYKDIVIILGSLFFYAWGANYFILFVIATCLIDYKLGSLIALNKEKKDKKLKDLLLFIDIFINLSMLIYFKYANFFGENINALFELLNWNPIVFTKIVLPVGISFVIFQKMTYCIDIAKGTAVPARYFYIYIEYLLIFPQIIAGPIVKYNLFEPQIGNKQISLDNIETGFKLFAVGIFKKVLIADVVARYADIAFNGPAGLIPIQYTWIGLLCYTFQIYFDFSAYSDMAIGLLKIMGFSIPVNFNNPYISKSINEFWQRWHISLTSWMREYMYIPLGGNRKGTARAYFNRWLVFLISGLWHGASWNFVVWGIYHGTLLCLEKLILLKKTERLPSAIKLICTMFFVMIGWVLFRANDMKSAFEFLRQMFDFSSINIHPQPSRILAIDNYGKFTILIAFLLSIVPIFRKLEDKLAEFKNKFRKITWVLYLMLFFVSILKVGTASLSPFIYFRF